MKVGVGPTTSSISFIRIVALVLKHSRETRHNSTIIPRYIMKNSVADVKYNKNLAIGVSSIAMVRKQEKVYFYHHLEHALSKPTTGYNTYGRLVTIRQFKHVCPSYESRNIYINNSALYFQLISNFFTLSQIP